MWGGGEGWGGCGGGFRERCPDLHPLWPLYRKKRSSEPEIMDQLHILWKFVHPLHHWRRLCRDHVPMTRAGVTQWLSKEEAGLLIQLVEQFRSLLELSSDGVPLIWPLTNSSDNNSCLDGSFNLVRCLQQAFFILVLTAILGCGVYGPQVIDEQVAATVVTCPGKLLFKTESAPPPMLC